MSEYMPILKNVGLAARARKITFGCEMTCDAIRAGKVSLVLLCADAASNTAKKLESLCEQNKVECYRVPIDAQLLASAVGKNKPLISVGVTDASLSVPVKNSIIALSNATSSQKISESEV